MDQNQPMGSADPRHPRPSDPATFTVVTGVLGLSEESCQEYTRVMQEIHVTRSGRYTLVSEPRYAVDPASGLTVVTVEFLDHGPGPRPAVF